VCAISFGSDGFLYVGTTIGGIFKSVSPEFTVNVLNIDRATLPTEYALRQNYPNPFNPSTTISFDLPEPTDVRLTIYDLIGRKIETIIDRQLQGGKYRIIWQANQCAGGVYFVRIEAHKFTAVRKLVYIK
jgi:hypothetical protein